MSDTGQPRGNPPRPFTRAQVLENAAFLAELRRTGNAREAARRLGAHRAKFTRRRARHPDFAVQWQAALTESAGRLAEEHAHVPLRHPRSRLQLRRARPEALGPDAKLTFLAGLCLGLDVRLAAESTGFSHAAFYHHLRHDPDFADAWRRATGASGPGPEAQAKPWPYLHLDDARKGERRATYEVAQTIDGRGSPHRRNGRRRTR
jgi:hypothetical protein